MASSAPIAKTQKVHVPPIHLTSNAKFCPKNPVRNVSGKKIVAMTVSYFMTLFNLFETVER